MKERIIKKIRDNIDVKHLVVTNKSHLHQEHLETSNKDETHFDVEISSPKLDELSLVNSHKLVKNLLKDEFEKNGLHSLTLKVLKTKLS
jgi:stress-induced morphogen